MNIFKRLFKKRKPLIYTSIEADRRYREDDPLPWQSGQDKSIDWDVGKPVEKERGKKKGGKRNDTYERKITLFKRGTTIFKKNGFRKDEG